MALYTAQVVFQGNTGLAKDRFMNTYHFTSGILDPSSAEMMTVAARVADFYVGIEDGAAVGGFLSSEINRIATINVYDHGEPTPRTPYPFHFTLPDVPVAQCLPEEIALCMSFYSAQNVPRQRGRVYLGPWGISALGPVGTQTSRPSPGLITAIRSSASRMALVEDGVIDISNVLVDGLFIAGIFLPGVHQSNPSFLDEAIAFPAMTSVNWVTYSDVGIDGTTPTKKHPEIPKHHVPSTGLVTAGWVDNEWDGQSRRRIDSSARSTWLAAV